MTVFVCPVEATFPSGSDSSGSFSSSGGSGYGSFGSSVVGGVVGVVGRLNSEEDSNSRDGEEDEGEEGRDEGDGSDAEQAGATPLFMACENGRVEVVEQLLAKGADVDKAKQDGATPLFVASQNGHVEVAKLLLAKGADVDKARQGGRTPLSFAIQNGHLEVAKLLLAKGADINMAGEDGWTPLFVASVIGRVEAVKLLLAKGADADKTDQDGRTPLSIAIQKGDLEVVRLLVPTKEESIYDPSKHRFVTKSPLGLAAMYNHLEILLFLLESLPLSFNPARIEPQQVLTEVFCCAVRHSSALSFRGQSLFLAMLLPRDSLVIEDKDIGGRTPLANAREIADSSERRRVTLRLSECGADIISAVNTARNQSAGNTNLHSRAFQGDSITSLLDPRMFILTDRTGTVNSTDDPHGRTPLHHAFFKGLLDMITELLDAGANLDTRDKHGFTPLHDLASNLDPEQGGGLKSIQPDSTLNSIVDLLVARDLLMPSLVGARNRAGHTAADIARHHGGHKLAARLEKISGTTRLRRYLLAPLSYVLLFIVCLLLTPVLPTLMSISIFYPSPLGDVFAHVQGNLELHPWLSLVGTFSISTVLAVLFLVVPRHLRHPEPYLLSIVGLSLLLPSFILLLRLFIFRLKATPTHWRPGTLFFSVPEPETAITLWSKSTTYKLSLLGLKTVSIPLNWKNALSLLSLVISLWQALSITFLPKVCWSLDPRSQWVILVLRSLFRFDINFMWFYASAVIVTVLALAFFSFIVIGTGSSIVPFGSKRRDPFAVLSRLFPFITRDFLSKLPLGSELASLLSGIALNQVSSVFLKTLSCDSTGLYVNALLPELESCYSSRHLFLAGFGSLLLVLYSAAATTLGLAFIRSYDKVEHVRITAAFQLVSNFAQIVGVVLGIFFEDQASVAQIYTIITYTLLFMMVLLHRPSRDVRSINLWLAWTSFAVAWTAVCNLTSIRIGPQSSCQTTGRYLTRDSKDLIPMIMLVSGWGGSLLVTLFAGFCTKLFRARQ